MKKKKYKSRRGIIPQKNAQSYGEYLYSLYKKDKKLSPKKVVNAARPKSSPIHDFFVWDNTEAGEKYREYQARALIKDLAEIIYDDDTEKNYQTNVAYYNVRDKNNKQLYVHVNDVVINDDYSNQVLNDIISRLIELTSLMNNFKRLLKKGA